MNRMLHGHHFIYNYLNCVASISCSERKREKRRRERDGGGGGREGGVDVEGRIGEEG